jgi:Ca2+-binding RTX toxin-like protein
MGTYINSLVSNNIIGTLVADTFTIPIGENGAGFDRFEGRAGNDIAYGGAGQDSLFGGDDNDTLGGGAGGDYLDGGNGDDSLAVTSGPADLFGGAGNDTMTSGATGHSHLYGGSGNDRFLTSDSFITGAGASSDIFGGAGNDYVAMPTLGSTARGGTDDDQVLGNVGRDTIYGGVGDDTLSTGDPDATRASDLVYGGEGADEIATTGGNDSLFGGIGRDLLVIARDYVSTGFDIDLEKQNDVVNAGSYGRFVIDGFEDVTTGGGADIVRGTSGNNTIKTGAGTDTIIGRGGADRISDGVGNDTVYGGMGNDIFNHAQVTLSSDQDRFFGGAGRDTFVFGEVARSIRARPDQIGDFERGLDKIDLSDLRGPGRVVFVGGFEIILEGDELDLTFVNRAAFLNNDEAQLRVARDRFEVDWDGNGKSDMVVILTNAGFLSRADFDLG